MLKVVPPGVVDPQDFVRLLDDLVRDGARQMLMKALALETEEYIARYADLRDETGKRLVVRNGKAQERTITVGAGAISLGAPRVDDRRDGEKFTSKILPPYLRKSPKVESLIPILYLKGLSTNAFEGVLTDFLGEGTQGLSPASIVQLKKLWEAEFAKWASRSIKSRYVYVWADGVNVKVRLGENKKICLLVLIGVTEDGKKELIAVHPGYRESKESWLTVLRELRARGFMAPLLAVGDGALGFWAALRACEGFEKTKEQRCWVHVIANVLDKLPKRLQPDAKTLLHEMMNADSVKETVKVKERFASIFKDKYPKAVECIEKSWDELTAFFKFPAAHWQHLRTTNPIESSFATVKLRTKVTRGAGSPKAAATMAFKLLLECEKKWRRVNKPEELKNLMLGLEYEDGIVIPTPLTHQEAAAG